MAVGDSQPGFQPLGSAPSDAKGEVMGRGRGYVAGSDVLGAVEPTDQSVLESAEAERKTGGSDVAQSEDADDILYRAYGAPKDGIHKETPRDVLAFIKMVYFRGLSYDNEFDVATAD